jgi:PAS domain S-box-containing protein
LLTTKHEDVKSLFGEFLFLLKDISSCSAVGLRLIGQKWITPYQIFDGFSKSLCDKECLLNIKSDEYLSINLIKGNKGTSKKFYTERSTFYMNNLSKYLASVNNSKKSGILDVFHESGFESVAIVPLRFRDEVLGLMQIADKDEDKIFLEVVSVLEDAALILGSALNGILINQERMKTERSYEAIAEDIPLLIDRFLPGGEMIYVNDAVCKYFGKTREELIGKNFMAMLPEGDRVHVISNISSLTIDSPVHTHEHQVIAPDGEIRWQRWTNRAIFDERGEVSVYQGVGEDITDQKRAENALKESEERFRTLCETMNHGLAVSNNKFELIYINKALADMSGYTPSEVLGKPQLDFVEEKSRENFLSQVDNRMKGSSGFYEVFLKRKDGNVLPVMISGTVLFDKDGKYNGSFGVITDLSKLKVVEEALRKSGEEYKNIVELMNDGLGIIDENDTILYVNPALSRMIGYEIEEIVGKNQKDFVPEDELHKFEQEIMRRQKGKRGHYQLSIRRKDGSKIFAMISSTPLYNENDKYYGTVSIMTDISDQKRVEEALNRSREELELRNKIADIFLTLPGDEMYVEVQKVIRKVLKSEYGLFGYIDEGDTLVVPTYSRAIPNKYVMEEKVITFELSSLKDTIIDRTISAKKIHISNEPLQVPEGHVGIEKAIISPIIFQGNVIGILMAANKKTDYNNEDCIMFDKIAAMISPILHARLSKKKIEETRQKVVRQQETILKTVLDGFHVVDMSGNLIEANEAICQMLGYTKDELLNMHIIDIDLIDQRGNVLERIGIIKERGKVNFETKLKKKDGSTLDADVSANYVPIDEGLIFVNVRDISERKKNEDRINRLNTILFAIKDVDQLVIQEKDRDLLIQGICHSLIQTRGYFNVWISLFDESGIFDKTFTAGVTENFQPMEKSLKRGDIPPCGLRVLNNKDLLEILKPDPICDLCKISNGFFDMNSMLYPLKYESRKYGLIAASLPITVEIKDDEKDLFVQIANNLAFALHNLGIEEKRSAAEQNLVIKDSAIESSINPIVLMDLEGKITYANPASLDLWKYKPNDIVGKSAITFLSPKDKTAEGLKVLKEKGTWSSDLFAETKDGDMVEIHVSANTVFDKAGDPVCLMASVLNVSQQKHMEHQLIQSERLAATGQLAAFVAHEINSPLQAISVMLGTLSKKYDNDLKLQSNMKLLQNAFGSIQGTVKKLLDLNRPGTEHAKPVNINKIINSTLSLMYGLLEKKKIKLEKSLSKKIPLTIASSQQLSQVFMNIINNAVEAMTGTLKVRGKSRRKRIGERVIYIKTQYIKEEILITFKDTGSGIPEEDLPHILDPFYTCKKELGMGVGLSICHGIIQNHNGTVEVNNSKEGGAIFKISLPVIK